MVRFGRRGAHHHDGDESASGVERRARAQIEALEREHGQRLFGFVRSLGVPDDDAHDVVQEALLRAFRTIIGGEPIVSSLAGTYRTSYRLAMDHHRRGRRLSAYLATSTAPAPAASADTGGFDATVWAEVDLLPPRQRSVLYLRFRGDLSFDDIGQVLQISSSAARSHCASALATLRKRMVAGVRQ